MIVSQVGTPEPSTQPATSSATGRPSSCYSTSRPVAAQDESAHCCTLLRYSPGFGPNGGGCTVADLGFWWAARGLEPRTYGLKAPFPSTLSAFVALEALLSRLRPSMGEAHSRGRADLSTSASTEVRTPTAVEGRFSDSFNIRRRQRPSSRRTWSATTRTPRPPPGTTPGRQVHDAQRGAVVGVRGAFRPPQGRTRIMRPPLRHALPA
jgi:hypothetical protein